MQLRRHRRVRPAPMYTLVRVRSVGRRRYQWSGHAYDISYGGMRFELDTSLAPGTEVDLCATLPGQKRTTFRATGHIIRLHNDVDEPGPVRMGMAFDRFANRSDRQCLRKYLSHALRDAA